MRLSSYQMSATDILAFLMGFILSASQIFKVESKVVGKKLICRTKAYRKLNWGIV